MPTSFFMGNLFDSAVINVIAHGCNCRGVMGAGFALQVQRKYPEVFSAYRIACLDGGFWLGSSQCVDTKDGKVVFNLSTQLNPGPCASLAHIESAVTDMLGKMEERGLTRVGMPVVGAGLGGLNRNHVVKLLKDIGDRTKVEIIVFELQRGATAR